MMKEFWIGFIIMFGLIALLFIAVMLDVGERGKLLSDFCQEKGLDFEESKNGGMCTKSGEYRFVVCGDVCIFTSA